MNRSIHFVTGVLLLLASSVNIHISVATIIFIVAQFDVYWNKLTKEWMNWFENSSTLLPFDVAIHDIKFSPDLFTSVILENWFALIFLLLQNKLKYI